MHKEVPADEVLREKLRQNGSERMEVALRVHRTQQQGTQSG